MATVTCCKVKAVLIIFDVNSVPVTKILPFPRVRHQSGFVQGVGTSAETLRLRLPSYTTKQKGSNE